MRNLWQNSGNKLVLALASLALVLGSVSWWYRYETARRASQFWGPQASRLIADSEGLELSVYESQRRQGFSLGPAIALTSVHDLSRARGHVHLRHAILSDHNYVWDQPLEDSKIRWKWHLRFFTGEQQTTVLLSDDLRAIGKYGRDVGESTVDRLSQPFNPVVALSCQPMRASLKQYFAALQQTRPSASTVEE